MTEKQQEGTIFEGLNAPQAEAVKCLGGPMLIVAGAGSGKTRVITMRIANLIANGVSPYGILALTFTNKAAREMKTRIGSIVGSKVASHLWMGTFHSMFARLLRIEAENIGMPVTFTIYDTQDSQTLIKSIIKGLGLDDKIYKPKTVHGMISSAKNDLLFPADYARDPDIAKRDRDQMRPRMAEIYQMYVNECRKAGAMDFDDLLIHTYTLFRNNPECLERYQKRFAHILVDEYQDTNRVQYAIVNMLAKANRNICVVGDDSQSIYSFRGARIENILNFKKDYPDCQVFKLEQNYRSTQTIVSAANSLIAKNINRIPKNVFSEGEVGEKIKIRQTNSDIEEAKTVVGEISYRVRSGENPEDIAILYRANFQSRVLEEALRHEGIPYKVYGGVTFYQRKEIKDVLAYLRLTVNHSDNESFKRVINYPKRAIGETSVSKLEGYANAHGMTLWEAASNPLVLETAGLKGATAQRILDFTAMVTEFSMQAEKVDAATLLKGVLDRTKIIEDLKTDKDSAEGEDRIKNVEELRNAFVTFVDEKVEEGGETSLSAYLTDIALMTDADTGNDENCVRLMTVHASKGLEFSRVFIVGLEDGLFPGSMSILDPVSLEEERRLMYVALTRAKKSLTLTYAKERFRNGETTMSICSRFLKELPEEMCDRQGEGRTVSISSFGPTTRRVINTPKPRFVPVSSQKVAPSAGEGTASSTPDGEFSVGDVVAHERFGDGVIESIIVDTPQDVKLKINFNNFGVKLLLLRFARIRKK
ncbi:MAG: UvrD-helicase domain-containing protein [Bacteroidales bacterium]|nr:UvrD-helicase domain-containing protein [Bacteroidales bacterium]